jgi:hypothetical protein
MTEYSEDRPTVAAETWGRQERVKYTTTASGRRVKVLTHRVGRFGARGVAVGNADEVGVWLTWDEALQQM